MDNSSRSQYDRWLSEKAGDTPSEAGASASNNAESNKRRYSTGSSGSERRSLSAGPSEERGQRHKRFIMSNPTERAQSAGSERDRRSVSTTLSDMLRRGLEASGSASPLHPDDRGRQASSVGPQSSGPADFSSIAQGKQPRQNLTPEANTPVYLRSRSESSSGLSGILRSAFGSPAQGSPSRPASVRSMGSQRSSGAAVGPSDQSGTDRQGRSGERPRQPSVPRVASSSATRTVSQQPRNARGRSIPPSATPPRSGSRS